MLKFRYCLLILLLIPSACKDAGTNGTDSPEEPSTTRWPVEPVEITFPEAVFTAPDKIKEGIPSTVIQDRLIDLIDATPEGSSIYISIYAFYDFEFVVNALERADSRNVRLHIMFDMSSHNEDLVSKNTNTVEELETWGDNVELVLVDNDAGAIAINHNKFVLFPEVVTKEGNREHVVFQTSHNFTESDTYRIQDAVTLSHTGLYQAYLKYWQDMRDKAREGMKYFIYREYDDPSAGIHAFFHPKRKEGEYYEPDTIMEILDEITHPSFSTIKIGMSGWSDSRVRIVDKLDELLEQDATIEVVTKSNIGTDVFNGLRKLEKKGAYVRIYNITDPGQQRINIHSKFMLIEGVWKGEETKVLLTGSQNFTNNALKYNNETTLLFQDHELFNIYKAYFEELKTLPGVCCSE